MCDYQGYEFGATNYPDSVCIDGSLHDADDCDEKGKIYLHPDEEHIPCPKCNKKLQEKEDKMKEHTPLTKEKMWYVQQMYNEAMRDEKIKRGKEVSNIKGYDEQSILSAIKGLKEELNKTYRPQKFDYIIDKWFDIQEKEGD